MKKIALAVTVVLMFFTGPSRTGAQSIGLEDGTITITPPATTSTKKDVGAAPTGTPAPTTAAVAPAATKTTAETPKKKTYTVTSGDYLIKIARELLGDPDRYWEIVELNKTRYPSIVKNPNLIYAGWELELPADASGDLGPGADVSEADLKNAIDGTVEVNGALNIRSKPWGNILGTFTNGDKIKILKREGPWYKIAHNGKVAYVHANYVTSALGKAGHTSVDRPLPDGDDYRDPSGPDATITTGNGRFGGSPTAPPATRVSSPFGYRTLFGQREFHSGIDLPIVTGTRLNSVGDGVVTAAGRESSGGIYVKIKYDNGLEMVYCHLKNYSVKTGQRVSQGQEIARSDNTGRSTGPHLHLAVRKNGQAINPKSVPGLQLP